MLPGCNGILHEKDLNDDKIPVENYESALVYISNAILMDDEEDMSVPENEEEEVTHTREEL